MSDADTLIRWFLAPSCSSSSLPLLQVPSATTTQTLWIITAISFNCKNLDELRNYNMGSVMNDLMRKVK